MRHGLSGYRCRWGWLRWAAVLAVAMGLMGTRPGWGYEVDIFTAAETGDVERLKSILDREPSLREIRRRDGYTALELAAKCGQDAVIAELLLRGATLDFLDHNGQLYLVELMHQHRWSEAQQWIQRGADVTKVAGSPAESGWQVLLTQEYSNNSPPKMDKQERYGRSGLRGPRQDFGKDQFDSKRDWLRLLAVVVDTFEKVDPKAGETKIALHFAIQQNAARLVELLFERGAQIEWVDVHPDFNADLDGREYYFNKRTFVIYNDELIKVLAEGPVHPKVIMLLALWTKNTALMESAYARGECLDANDFEFFLANMDAGSWVTDLKFLTLIKVQQPNLFLTLASKPNILVYASESNSDASLKFLWEQGIRLPVRRSDISPELEAAVEAQNWAGVEFLLANGAQWRAWSNGRDGLMLVPKLALDAQHRQKMNDRMAQEEFQIEFYRRIAPLPVWLPVMLLMAVLLGLERHRLRRLKQETITGTAAPVVPGSTATANTTDSTAEWGQRSHLNPEQLGQIGRLVGLQAASRSRLRTGVASMLVLLLIVFVDPFLSQATLEIVISKDFVFQYYDQPQYSLGPGWMYLFMLAPVVVGLAAVGSGLAGRQSAKGARAAWLYQCVGSVLVVALAGAMCFGIWNWIGESVLVIGLGFQSLLAGYLAMDGWLAFRRQQELVRIERSLKRTATAAEVATEVDVVEGWDEGKS